MPIGERLRLVFVPAFVCLVSSWLISLGPIALAAREWWNAKGIPPYAADATRTWQSARILQADRHLEEVDNKDKSFLVLFFKKELLPSLCGEPARNRAGRFTQGLEIVCGKPADFADAAPTRFFTTGVPTPADTL